MNAVHQPLRVRKPAPDRRDDQRQRDQLTGLVVLLVAILLSALVLWMASLGDGSVQPSSSSWMWMP